MFLSHKKSVVISFKHTADDEAFTCKLKFFNSQPELAVIPKICDCIAALYDEHRWIGMAVNMDNSTQPNLMAQEEHILGPEEMFLAEFQNVIIKK